MSMNDMCPKLIESLSRFLKMESDKCHLICTFFKYRLLKKGELLFNEGSNADFVALVISGALEVKKETEFPGKFIVLSIISVGDVVGELAVVARQDAKRSATVTALEDTELALIDRRSYDDFCSRFPVASAKLLKQILYSVCYRLKGANKRLAAIF
jgi:CRP-like cAMP-binding protein